MTTWKLKESPLEHYYTKVPPIIITWGHSQLPPESQDVTALSLKSVATSLFLWLPSQNTTASPTQPSISLRYRVAGSSQLTTATHFYSGTSIQQSECARIASASTPHELTTSGHFSSGGYLHQCFSHNHYMKPLLLPLPSHYIPPNFFRSVTTPIFLRISWRKISSPRISLCPCISLQDRLYTIASPIAISWWNYFYFSSQHLDSRLQFRIRDLLRHFMSPHWRHNTTVTPIIISRRISFFPHSLSVVISCRHCFSSPSAPPPPSPPP